MTSLTAESIHMVLRVMGGYGAVRVVLTADTSATGPLIVICREHGSATRPIGRFVSQTGVQSTTLPVHLCPKCGKLAGAVKASESKLRSSVSRMTQDAYRMRCASRGLNRNGDRVEFHLGSEVDFSGKKEQNTFEYTCPLHGRRSNRLVGYLNMRVGCSACSWELRNEVLKVPNKHLVHSMADVVARAAKLNPKLDFSAVDTRFEWTGYANHPPVRVRCRVHPAYGLFDYLIQCGRRGSTGCPECINGSQHAKRTAGYVQRLYEYAATHGHTVVAVGRVKDPLVIHCNKHGVDTKICYAEAYYRGSVTCTECTAERRSELLLVPDTIRDKVSGSFRSLPEKSLAVSIAGIVPAPLSVGKRYKFLGGKELDIAIKEHMVAVEVNGVYWHDTSRAKSKYAHRDKAKACSENGITLLQFTCQDIDRKLDLVTSMVAAKCGVFSTKLHARKCSVVPLTAAVARSFLDQHHISGFAAGSSYFGLRQGNRLACVAVFGKPRFDKKADWELVRFATHQTVHISGGLSRLVSSFRKSHPGVLVSYADLRYSNAKGYVASGWKFDRVSTPGYVWVRGGEELSRYQTQKHKLESVLEDFDPSLSESENMRNNKFFQIHDCGHAIFYLR